MTPVSDHPTQFVDDGVTWEATLALFEAGLDHHRRVLDVDEDATTGPWPPATLPQGPIPTELIGRAQQLLDDAQRLSDALTGRLAGLDAPQAQRRQSRAPADRSCWTTTL